MAANAQINMYSIPQNAQQAAEYSAQGNVQVGMDDYIDTEHGLTQAQVAWRMENGLANEEVDASSRSVKDIIIGNLCTYFNLIFLILAILLCLVGAFRNLTFLPVIIANTLIGIIQEIRAKRVLDKMNMLAAPKSSVLRDGAITVIPSQELVRDDIVEFAAGAQICADARVVSGEVLVNESLLTGESEAVMKRTGDELISGSFVAAGGCRAQLTAVGADSYISRLTIEAKEMKTGEQSQMMRSLNRLLKIVGVVIIPVGIALFCQSYFINDETVSKSVTSAVAAVVGMIPEGLYLLTSVALAVSAMRLARKRVLLHDMKSIETLARVDVLCVDKTGTITENKMSVRKLVPIVCQDGAQSAGSGSVQPEVPAENRAVSVDTDSLERLIGDFAAAMSNDNATMEALKEHFVTRTNRVALHIAPFSSALKYSAVVFEDAAYVLGAPEMVLREDYSAHEKEIMAYASKGYRVLVFGKCAFVEDGKPISVPVEPLAYILMANPIREAAPETFAYFKEQGVAIKVISGDNPLTVAEAAREANIAGAERYIDARSLHTEEDIDRAMNEYTVFGRVTPDQKRLFVKSLQKQGHTVAMTGDGVNDVLALKDADCSVAMASGSEAAVEASQVVLLDSDFACMPQVVLEGRRVVNNIERSASLFLVKNIFSILLSVFSLVSVITYPLEPSQISLVSMFTIGIPGFFLALEPNSERIRGRFLPNVLIKALPAAVTDLIAVGALAIFGETFGVDSTDISTAATILLGIVGFMILYKIARPSKWTHWVIITCCIAGFVLFGIFLDDLYGIYDMSTKCVMLCVVFAIATEPVFRYLSSGVEKLQQLWGVCAARLSNKIHK
ncbi:MAG: cation-translocating P-type ATPase [Clostridiales bacterium]|nr:cation-translocating P-type ATPase [Clostridiales bacterium]